MSRVQRKMYKRARGQATVRRAALLLTAACLLFGLAGRTRQGGSLTAEPIARPTATPVSLGFDETVVSRELALESMTWYALQTGIFSTQEAAEAKALAYADRGAPGYVYPDGDKYRVLIACYGTQSDAAAVQERLASKQEVDVYLHRWTLPALTLRLTGMAGQLDVAEAGMQLLRQSAVLLRDGAAAVDRGEKNVQDALNDLSQIDEQFRLWRQTARQRFVKPYPTLIAQQLTLADGWDQQYAAMTGAATSSSAMSAAMKIQAMTLYTHLAQLHRLLEAE